MGFATAALRGGGDSGYSELALPNLLSLATWREYIQTMVKHDAPCINGPRRRDVFGYAI
jgi:hypothetical protein